MADVSKVVALPLSRDRQRLVEEALPMVRKLARAFAHLYGYDRDELIGHGSLALTEAARRFDPSEEVPFAGFAYPRVRGEMLDRAGAARREARRFCAREPMQAQLDLSNDPDPLVSETQARAGVAQNAAALAAAFALHEASSGVPSPEDAAVALEADVTRSGGLRTAVSSLDDEGRQVVELHYFNDLPLKDVADRMGIPYRTLRRRHMAVLESLSKRMRSAGVSPALQPHP